MKYIVKSGKKDISKLVKKKIVNKLGRNQTVWVRPEDLKYLRPPIKMTDKPVSTKIRLLGLKLHVKQYEKTLKTTGSLTLLGQKIESPQQLAALAEVYRNPYYETLRIIMVNDENKVMGVTSLSCHEPNFSNALLGKDIQETSRNIQGRMAAIGATKYWLVHNHPSGYSEPSDNDRYLTGSYAFHIPGFQGHIITNHKVYHYLEVKNIDNVLLQANVEATPILRYNKFQIDPLLENPTKPHKVLGMHLLDKDSAIKIAYATNYDKKNCALAIVRNAHSKVSAVLEIPYLYFEGKDESKLDHFFKNLRMMGGGEVLLVASKNIFRTPAFVNAFMKGHLLDGVTYMGESYSMVDSFGLHMNPEGEITNVKEESVGSEPSYYVIKQSKQSKQ